MARNEMFPILLPTDQTMLDSSCFVDTLKAIPVPFWNGCQAWLETVHVISFVTSITQKKRIFVIARVTQLAKRFHYWLVPGNRSFQDIKSRCQLSRCLGLFNSLAPSYQSSGKIFFGFRFGWTALAARGFLIIIIIIFVILRKKIVRVLKQLLLLFLIAVGPASPCCCSTRFPLKQGHGNCTEHGTFWSKWIRFCTCFYAK